MNRKQTLKRLKKEKKAKNTVTDTNYANRFVMTLGLVLLVSIASYLVIGIFITKTIKFGGDEEEKTEVVIDNNTILAGQIFDQKEEEYYVLVYDVSDTKTMVNSWKSLYSGKENALKVYVVNSKISLNNNYIVKEDSNTSPTGYEDLKIKAPTLIKISNKTVTEYVEGEDEIKNVFNK
ncbi:MAG: hypothetical protein IKF36_05170 [Bacilli bacterium]|nr:hypothetical protein [Bacilli bacterium]